MMKFFSAAPQSEDYLSAGSPSTIGLMSGALWADPWPGLAFTQAQQRAEVAGTGV